MIEEAGPSSFVCAGNCSRAVTEQLPGRVKESLLFKLCFGSADGLVQSLTAGQLNDD